MFNRVPFERFLFNSVFITATTTAFSILFSSLAGFSFAFLKWRGKGIVLSIIIATLIIPAETTAVPLLFVVNSLPWIGKEGLEWGWLNSIHVQIIPFIADSFSIFLFVQFFRDLPRELVEAARMDGATWLQVYARVIMPITGPVVATVAILKFLGMWNQYLWPLMVAQSEEMRPLMLGVAYFFQLDVAWGEVMAYLSTITIPVLIFYLALQRAFIEVLPAVGLRGKAWLYNSPISGCGIFGLHARMMKFMCSTCKQATSLSMKRHWNVSIGHAKSKDLVNWGTPTGCATSHSPHADRPLWDDKTTWTGSIIQDDGLWYLFYTGSSGGENGLVQRIGLATSRDLIHGKIRNQPLIEIDPRWYELLDLSAWHDQAWRDPCVFRHPHTGRWHCFITARAKHGAPDGRGVIGHAVSDNLLHWEVLPPITQPGEFGDMEVPQWLAINGRYYVLLHTERHHSQARLARPGVMPQGGTHYLVSDSPTEGFHYLTAAFSGR
jgi:multiple sugar transport system permease protein